MVLLFFVTVHKNEWKAKPIKKRKNAVYQKMKEK